MWIDVHRLRKHYDFLRIVLYWEAEHRLVVSKKIGWWKYRKTNAHVCTFGFYRNTEAMRREPKSLFFLALIENKMQNRNFFFNYDK